MRSDQTVILGAIESAKAYPDPLRRVSYFDAATNKRLKFLTNNFALPALTIAEIYRSHWQVELFFKWIKQLLRIKKFYGAGENVVKTQIWIIVSVYVLVAIVRKRLGLEASLYQILQILSVTLFEKTPILQALQASDSHENLLDDANQTDSIRLLTGQSVPDLVVPDLEKRKAARIVKIGYRLIDGLRELQHQRTVLLQRRVSRLDRLILIGRHSEALADFFRGKTLRFSFLSQYIPEFHCISSFVRSIVHFFANATN